MSVAYCVRCQRERRWFRSGGVNGDRPCATYWRCTGCGYERIQMADVTDALQLARSVLQAPRRATAAATEKLEAEELELQLYEQVWKIYRAWDGRGTFLGYATMQLRRARANWYRDELGRDLPKAHAVASSLDALLENTDDDHDPEDGEQALWMAPVCHLEHDLATTADLDFALDAEGRKIMRGVVTLIEAGCSYSEIAEFTGESAAWVSAQVGRVRDQLRPGA